MDLSDILAIIKMINYTVGFIAICIGIDLICGARMTSLLRRILDRTIIIVDHVMIRIGGLIRKTLDTELDFDEKILRAQGRIISGIVLIIFAVVLILLSRRI